MTFPATPAPRADLHFDLPYAEIREVKTLDYNYDNHLEVRQAFPGSLGLYLRTHNGIGEYGKGVKRNMLGVANLNVQEVVALRNLLNQWLELEGGAK